MTDAEGALADDPGAPWHVWFSDHYVAYLLRDAAGEPRPVEDVRRVLARLSGEDDALSHVAAIAFLLGPSPGVARWILEEVPVYLRRMRVRSKVNIDARRHEARGSVDWGRTFAMRTATRDETWLVTRAARRDFETPELVTVRYVIERVRATGDGLLRRCGEAASGWLRDVGALVARAKAHNVHSALQHAPTRRPESWERAIARTHADPVVRRAAALLDAFDRLLPEPEFELLSEVVARYALAPLIPWARFQLFTLLRVLAGLDELLAGWVRTDGIVVTGRDAVASWEQGGERVLVFYDSEPENARHADAMRHYFGAAQSLRPDIRMVHEGKGCRELIVDAKYSTSVRYLAKAHHQMNGYLADRPDAFARSQPKAMVTCMSRNLGEPRPDDEVVFVGVDGCLGEVILNVVGHWWHGAQ